MQHNAKKKNKTHNILAEPRIKQPIYSDQTMLLKAVIKELLVFETTFFWIVSLFNKNHIYILS